MLKIRLQRIGRRNDPHFRVVVTEHTTSPRGKAVEQLGFVDPQEKKQKVDKERVLYWISKGAQVSPTVHNLFVSQKILEGKKVAKHHTPKKEEKSEAKPAQEAASAPATPAV